MAVFRVERNKGYTVMSNHHLRNKELTLKAKGLPNKQFLTDRAGRNTEKGTLFLCLLRKFFLLPTTPGMSDLANFRKRKTLQLKIIATLLSPYSILAGQGLFSLTLNLCDLPRRGGDYPYSRIAHIVQQRVKLPPLGILPGGLLQKELVYRDIVTQHKLKEYL